MTHIGLTKDIFMVKSARGDLDWRKFKGQHELGQQDWEPLRGKSASERVSERTSENLSKKPENLSKTSQNLWKPLKTSENLLKPLKNLWKTSLSESLSETFSEADSLSEALGPVAPSVLPLELSPTRNEAAVGS